MKLSTVNNIKCCIMGTLRFLLAVAVVLFHSGGIFGYCMTGGGPSVQGFYVVSGFFMALILNEKYLSPCDNYIFYSNRAMRIFITYWFLLLLSIAWYSFCTDGPIVLLISDFKRLSYSSLAYIIASNIFIAGMDAGLFMGLHDGKLVFEVFNVSPLPRVHNFFLVPQAWSLGIEISFYMLAPFLLRRHWLAVLTVAVVALTVRIASGLDQDPWTNRFFPFELMVFLLGVLSFHWYVRIKSRELRIWERFVAVVPVIMVIIYPIYGAEASIYHPGRIILLVVIPAGLPYLFHMTRHISADRLIGNLSYPLYLCHGLVVVILTDISSLVGTAFSSVALFVSIFVAAVTVIFIEAPVERVRQARWLRLR